MTVDEQLQQFREHTLAALRKIPGARWYALDETARDSLAFFGVAWQDERAERNENFSIRAYSDVVAQIVALTPSLRQERPEQSPSLPEVWKDCVTGQIARNPWSEPIDLESQA